MSKKEKIDLKIKIDTIVYAMQLVSERIDKERGFMIRCEDEDTVQMQHIVIDILTERLLILEDIRAKYQKRLSQ